LHPHGRLRAVADEVPPAHDLDGVFHRADEGNRINRGIEGAADDTLPADCGGHGQQGYRRANPGRSLADAPQEAALAVLDRLLLNGHLTSQSKNDARNAIHRDRR